MKAAKLSTPLLVMSLFKTGVICLVLQGRYAGRKAVVVEASENLVTVVGMKTYPKPKTAGTKAKEGETSFETFIKQYHARHLMPTRYTFKNNLNAVVNNKNIKEANLKKKAVAESQKQLADAYNKDGSQWLFRKLNF